ncbi:RWD domain containing protein 2B [Fusarium agapanthi]|uniref:RWD domain containing protein 2B n=1 Tax=Fusarium agapanthi TaxID=1803897 RepID=A0A9P5B9I6_9HYPO|nr:RWD domain containing protein 2B [Fusarium agapanthi]
MPSDEESQNALPKELMELQLGQIDLLMAMYASDDAIAIDSAASGLIERLREWCESDEEATPKFSETVTNLQLRVDVEDEDSLTRTLQLTLTVPLKCQKQEEPLTEPPPIKTRIQQPDWMSKGDIAKLNTEIPEEDILSVIEHIKDAASQHLMSLKQAEIANTPTADTSLVRVWFYFPSISTRAKRDDFINYAPTYGLTGFLLAGKPGILCLEGGSVAIDDFMKFIKTESWGDIPAHHKKVSERYREEATALKRAFSNMQEITDMIEKRGARGNRGDMKALEAWLVECGLGEAFGKILM